MNYNHELIPFSERHPIHLFINKIDRISPHWHQSLEISAVIQGRATLQISDQSLEFVKGDVFLVNPNEIHSLGGKGTLLCTLQVRLDQLEHLPYKEIPYFSHSFKGEEGKEIRNIFASLLKYNTVKEEEPTSLLETSLIYRLLYFLFSKGISQEGRLPSKDSLDRLSSLLAYINSEYSKDISLKSLAETEFLSESYLSRYFKENVQMTFSAYLKSVRLNKAVELLLTSSQSINQISSKVGFPNSRAFVSAFREKYKENPSSYRRNHQKDNTISTGDEKKDLYRSFNYLDDSFEEDRASVTKFIVRNSKPTEDENKSASLITSENITTIPLSLSDRKREDNHKNYLTMIGAGRVKDILSSEIQKELKTLQEEIGFTYIKLHSVFDDDLMAVTKSDGKLNFNFTFVDEAYDFLLSVHLKPLVQLSFLPGVMAGENAHRIFLGKTLIGYPKDIGEWNTLVRTFLLHLLNRYGREEVESWLFGVWNEPASVNQLFGLKDEEYYSLYENTYHTLKSVDSNLVFGGPASFSTYGKKDDWLFSFLAYAKKKEIIPDYISIHYYDIDLSWIEEPKETKKDIPNRIYLSPDENSFYLFLSQIKEKIKALGITSPLYITEWNNTVSHKDLLSDTCFKSAYLVKNLLETHDMVSSYSYWSLSDNIDENLLPKELFHGGLGLFTYTGLKKPSYYAYVLLKKLGEEVIKKGEGYFLTKGKDGDYRMIFYYYVPYNYEYSRQMDYQINMRSRDAFFKDRERKAFQLQLSGFVGKYEEHQIHLSPESGSVYDLARESGNLSFERMDWNYLSRNSHMKEYFSEKKFTGVDYLTYELSPLEVLYVQLKKREE